mmetsp:Transcript_36191/g.31934  ORF Transcript_36191/g.31934 Transcript_36191/m.31934 type:complete len:99 (+) Transcript_36191:2-298(+)
MSAGAIQGPTGSKLKCNHNQHTAAIKYVSFYEFDLSTKVYGVMTYQYSNLYKLSIDEILDIQFQYGWGGYRWVGLFNSSNKTHREFIEEYLEYYSYHS